MSPAEDNDSFRPRHILLYFKYPFQMKDLGKNWWTGSRERPHKTMFFVLWKKKKETKGAAIDRLFFYLVTPSFPAKKGNRTISLSGTVRYYSGAVLWNSLPSFIRKTKSVANFRQMLSVSVNWHGIQWKQALTFLSSFRFYVIDICLFLLLSYICIYTIVHRLIKSL